MLSHEYWQGSEACLMRGVVILLVLTERGGNPHQVGHIILQSPV